MNIEERMNLVNAWISFQKGEQSFAEYKKSGWAVARLSEMCLNEPEEGWEIIETIRHLDESDLILSNLAAGPLEDLLVAHGGRFIDRIEALAKDDQQLRKLLGATWQNGMSDALWARISAVAAPSW